MLRFATPIDHEHAYARKYARRRSEMKSDPYPLHIASAVASLAFVVLVWALVV
jgi:hypothetical protein